MKDTEYCASPVRRKTPSRGNWTKQRLIASDHSAVNGLSDTHEGRGHTRAKVFECRDACTRARRNAGVNGWLRVGVASESKREKEVYWRDMEGCFRRSEERTQPLLVASIASLRSLFTLTIRSPLYSLSLPLFLSPRLEFALTDWLWLAGRSSVCQFKVVAFITREYNGWRGSLEWPTSFTTSKCRYKLLFSRTDQK